MRSLVLALVALAMLPACGKDEPAEGPGTTLTIRVTVDEGADPRTYELTCDPAGGDHPQPRQACAALDRAGARVFRAVPKDRPCTLLYGGPQTALVRGSYHGKNVDATFTRADGCEINRWDELGTTVFDVPLQ